MQNKSKDALIEWFIGFIKHKDIVQDNLKDIEKDKGGYDLKLIYQDKEEYVIVVPFVKDSNELLDKIDKEKRISVVLFNSKDNFNMLLDNWKKLINFDKLTIYFANMFSASETKWIIRPYMHNMISEEASLKKGLKSMFGMVESITQDILEKKDL